MQTPNRQYRVDLNVTLHANSDGAFIPVRVSSLDLCTLSGTSSRAIPASFILVQLDDNGKAMVFEPDASPEEVSHIP